MIPALVLTAGLATRLRPLSLVRAKAALPVAGEPLVRRILRSLAAAGIDDVVLNLHHLPHTLTAVVGDGSDLGLRVRYSWEMPLLGSAGGPRRALDAGLLSRADPPEPARHGSFLIVNGDTLTDVDVRALVDDHRTHGALVTLAAVPNTAPGKYGGVSVDADGRFTGVVPRGSADPSYHFVGVQVVESGAFAPVPSNTPYESVRTLYPALMASQPGSVRVFRTEAEFLDIGTPDDYLETSIRLAAREARDLAPGPGGHVDATARVERSILWDDVVVEAGAVVRECIVTDGVRVPADTAWHGVTLRVAAGELASDERRIEGLAIAPLRR